MRKRPFLLPVLALLSLQAIPSAMASDYKDSTRYGCCLIEAVGYAGDVWEYTEQTAFSNCYLWSKLVGNPFEPHQDRKFEFYRDQQCKYLNKPGTMIRSLYNPLDPNS